MSQENNFIPNQKPYCNLRPFPLFMKNNFPFIENTYESLDIYGLLCKIVEYLNNVINNENIVTENQQALYNAFTELNDYVSHYFDNLDVQEEINNKLDDMVESGVLPEIIADYLNSKAIFGYDTVNDMKNATNLIDGSYARTLGYYSKNDGGSALYKIRNITNEDIVDNAFIIQLNNENLIAEIIINNTYIPECLGAKNDGTTDCSLIFNSIFSKMRDNNKLVMTGTYLIDQPLYLPNYNNIVISGGTLKANNFNGYILNSNPTERMGYSGWEFSTENLTIENVFFDGNYKANGLYLDSYLRVKVISCTFHNFKEYGIYLNSGHECQLIGTNLIGKANGVEPLQNTGICIKANDNIIDSCVVAYCQWAISIENQANQIINSHFYCNESNGGNIKITSSFALLDNNYFDGSGIYVIKPWHLNICNNLFLLTDATNDIIKFETTQEIPNPSIESLYITNTLVMDNRTNKTDIEFVQCSFTPTSSEDCYIENIKLPTHVLLSNPQNIFSFKNSNSPIIVPNSFFRASNTNSTIGTHYDYSDNYEVVYNGNFVSSNYKGSQTAYPWLFFKIYVPEKMRISRNLANNTSAMAIFDSQERFINNNIATLEQGYYYIGIYRTVDMYISH